MAVDKSGAIRRPNFVPPQWVAARQVDVRHTAQRWLESAAFQQLIAALGGPDPTVQDLGALVRWSANVLDTRRGAERRDAIPTIWPSDQARALMSTAGPLGLLETAEPCRSAYEITILAGGATAGNRLRTGLARDLLNRGVDLGALVAVTAERTLSNHEHATDPDSVDDRTEWSNLLRHLANAFGPLRGSETTTGGTGSGAWQDQKFVTPTDRELRLLVAPSRSANRRANTSDGLRFFLERIPRGQRHHIMIITSAIYAPYQFFGSAPLILSNGAEHVELVGTPTATDADSNLLTQQIAQEIHGAIATATNFLQAYLANPVQTP